MPEFATRLHGQAAALITLLVATCLPAIAFAAAPAPEFQKRVRAATFEVVLPKAVDDPLTYAGPLPLELIPYAERIDAYWSIGTAVAIGPNTFVTASHVLQPGIGRQDGPPALRDNSGNVYALDRVLQFSLAEDYAVFSLAKPPASLQPLATTETYAVDDAVFAVGNALGEGVVIRDGLLTSLTPESRSGRWKWLRFSAATSPGNSGGPLLDSEARVLGIVTAKSPNENLNYALPIVRVLQGSTQKAILESYVPFQSPILRDPAPIDYSDSFPLPASFADFSRQFIARSAQYAQSAEARLLAEQSAQLFPRGDTAEFFAESHRRYDPSYLAQQDDKRWGIAGTGYDFETPVPPNGRVWNTLDPRFTLFRVEYPEGLPDARRYDDAKEFMDLLLKGLRLQRMVGTQPVRIVSLGNPTQASEHRDAHRRIWQVRRWPLAVAESEVVTYALPTPDGYVGVAMQYMPAQTQAVDQQLRKLADYFFVSFTGTLPQWRAYLDRKNLRAGAFDGVQVTNDPVKGLAFRSPRFAFEVPRNVMAFDDASRLNVLMSYVQRDDGVVWGPVGTVLEQSPTKSNTLKINRQAKPAPGVKRERQHRWEQMTARTGDFSGIARRSDDQTEYWFRTVAAPHDSAAAGKVLYEVEYSTHDVTTPRELEARRDQLLKLITVNEP